MDYKIRPVQKSRLSEKVVHAIKQAIYDRIYEPGEALPTEQELADQFQVSRTAIREALRALAILRYIEPGSGSRRGYVVREITVETVVGPLAEIFPDSYDVIIEILKFRILIETEFARIAARESSETDLDPIRESLEIMQREIEAGEIGLKGENAFHDAIAAANHNSISISILKLMKEMLSLSRSTTLRNHDQPLKSLEDHRRIYDAVRSGRADDAADLMRRHLTKALRTVESSREP